MKEIIFMDYESYIIRTAASFENNTILNKEIYLEEIIF